MTDPLSPHSDDLREYFFSAAPEIVVLDTIELRHPLLATPQRFVNDPADLVATLEAGAPVGGGTVVTFSKGAFAIIPPESSSPGMPTCTIECLNVSAELQATLEKSVSFAAPVEISYRQYLSDDLSEPAFVLHGLTLKSVSAGILRVKAEAGFDDFLNRASPKRLYTAKEFPGLVR